MKKIAMFTMGTRGDVQPYIYLSKALMNAGHDVVLGTHPCWRELVEGYGITLIEIVLIKILYGFALGILRKISLTYGINKLYDIVVFLDLYIS